LLYVCGECICSVLVNSTEGRVEGGDGASAEGRAAAERAAVRPHGFDCHWPTRALGRGEAATHDGWVPHPITCDGVVAHC
jgi:hypothetical protein